MLRRAKPFDRGDAIALMHDRQRQARIDAPSVDDHGAGAALAVIAALLGAGEMQMFAECIQQRRAGIDIEFTHGAVHRERHLCGWGHDGCRRWNVRHGILSFGGLGGSSDGYRRRRANKQVPPRYFEFAEC